MRTAGIHQVAHVCCVLSTTTGRSTSYVPRGWSVMKRGLVWVWWAVAVLALVAVTVNILHPHPTDDAALAAQATAALNAESLLGRVFAVGATTDGLVYVTLPQTKHDLDSDSRTSAFTRSIASTIFQDVPSAQKVEVLDANHTIIHTYERPN